MKFTTIAQAKRETGLSYLGAVSQSSKTAKAEKFGWLTYTLYLAPGKQSGYEVCPNRTPECTAACLAFSGRNRFDLGAIDKARIEKTRLYFEHRDFFCGWLFAEIEQAERTANRKGKKLSVRLNGTSDICPTTYVLNGKNVLEAFPHIEFYDYTKDYHRMEVQQRYENYHVTLSYTGRNNLLCHMALESGSNVAIVFEGLELPDRWMDRKVIDGDVSDLRFLDEKGSVVGLRFKQTRHKVRMENNPFIIPKSAFAASL